MMTFSSSTELSSEQNDSPSITLTDIQCAHTFLEPLIRRTPLVYSPMFSTMTGAEIYLKYEQMQRGGSFKVRGALYKLSQLTTAQKQAGVIAASAGNHAQGVAIAAAHYGIACTIVMPENAPLAKVTATEGYGARVVRSGLTYDDAYQRCLELQRETGATYIHAFDDSDIITGQGTLALEVLHDLPDVDVLVVPIGGGGLISGMAIAARALKPSIKIIGVEAEGAAGIRASLDAGQLRTLPSIATIADGIAIKRPGTLNFPLIKQLVDDVVVVNDEAIIKTVLLLIERSKIVIEGAGAAGLAALLSGAVTLTGQRVALPLTGGNLDINLVGRFVQRGLASAGRSFVLRILLRDQPGELMHMLSFITDLRINILDIRYQRLFNDLPLMEHEAIITLETENRLQCAELVSRLRSAGYVSEEVKALK